LAGVEPPFLAYPTGAPRRWVRLPRIADQHAQASRALILQAAASVELGRVIVLGAGRCQEIPLAELLGRFRHVTLNDLDDSLLRAALAEPGLDPERAAAVERLVADLTGSVDRFAHALAASLEPSGLTAPAAVERLAETAAAWQPPVLNLGRRYDLVIASCVLCQLHVAASARALALFEARFPGRGPLLRRSALWTGALYALARRMEDVFIDGLHGLVAPGGRIYLSDTVRCCFIQATAEGPWITDGAYRMTRTPDLADYLDARFSIEHRAQWHWVVGPPQDPGQVGKLFEVQGMVVSVAEAPSRPA
jgi:hypothetical protein